jgi:hypothetical protein
VLDGLSLPKRTKPPMTIRIINKMIVLFFSLSVMGLLYHRQSPTLKNPSFDGFLSVGDLTIKNLINMLD